jgi:amidase
MRRPGALADAFEEYERALMADDLPTLDRLFAPGPETLRGDADGLLAGHDSIREFRELRGGAPARTVVATHVRMVGDDAALVVAVTELERGGRGLQTQLWARDGADWKVSAAHVSTPPPALDRRIWRVVGDPLVPAHGPGVLEGHTVAVKDLYAVAGHRIGAGNPHWLESAGVEKEHAWVVDRLLSAGATVVGIARTDEFAYSLRGTNAHYGAPPNPRAPHRVPGGSSSGPASAVSLGHATIGLGTDTGGSIRVPAAYQGLYGIRTTHGAVPLTGVLGLAPSFDTVGWLTREPGLLAAVGDVLLPPAAGSDSGPLLVCPALLRGVQTDVVDAVLGFLDGVEHATVDWDLSDLPAWLAAFQMLQAAEAWQLHGAWLGTRLETLGADVRSRFDRASRITAEQAAEARLQVTAARERIRDLVGDSVLVLPSASSVAPLLAESDEDVRNSTMRLTCLAGLAGLPAVSIPVSTAADLPAGVCLVAAPGRDQDLLRLATELPRPDGGG